MTPLYKDNLQYTLPQLVAQSPLADLFQLDGPQSLKGMGYEEMNEMEHESWSGMFSSFVFLDNHPVGNGWWNSTRGGRVEVDTSGLISVARRATANQPLITLVKSYFPHLLIPTTPQERLSFLHGKFLVPVLTPEIQQARIQAVFAALPQLAPQQA